MKLKGVNPIVQHIEKAVLGLTVVVFLAVISLQFVSQPNKVKVGNRDVNPDQIYNELASNANALQSQISDRSPALPDVQPVNLVERYNQAFDSNADSTTQLASALGQGVDIASLLSVEITTDRTGGGFSNIESMPVPATSTPIATTAWGTLDPFAILQIPEYADFVPAAQPFDFPSVSIEADFSGTDLRDILEGNENFPGVPRLFWVSTGMALMAMDVQRQELQPDGSWSASQPISTPPGTPLPTNAVNKNDGLVRLNTIIKHAQAAAPQVMRPMFPPTISGPLWKAPSESIDAQAMGLTDTQRANRQLTRLVAEVNRLKNPTNRTTSRSSSGKSARSSRDSRGSGGRTVNRADTNTIKIERLESQIDTIKATLQRLGIDTDTQSTESDDILDQDYIQLWAHDMGVTPGATYRYRTRVVLNNPYFRKGPYLDESNDTQQALTIEPFVSGAWSTWSQPIDVGNKEFFFVTEASKPVVGADLPQARVEIYSMYYGYYRRSSMNISEGQPLMADIRISGDFFMIDTNQIDADDTAQYINNLNEGNDDTDLPNGLSPAPDRLSVNLDAYMIQVANDPLPPSNDTKAQSLRLLFRLHDGTLIQRVPALDTNSQLYSQAQSSAAMASRSQLRPTGQPAKSEAAELFETVQP